MSLYLTSHNAKNTDIHFNPETKEFITTFKKGWLPDKIAVKNKSELNDLHDILGKLQEFI